MRFAVVGLGRWDGAAFMAGGPREACDVVAPLLKDPAVDDEAVFCAGPTPWTARVPLRVVGYLQPRRASRQLCPTGARSRRRTRSPGGG